MVKTYHKKRFWATILVVQIVLFYILSKINWAIRIFEDFFEIQKKLHQQLFSWLAFSVGDLFYTLLIIFVCFIIFKIFNRKNRNYYLKLLLIIINIFYFSYQIFWGMLYFQKPIINKLPKTEITLEKRKNLALKYLQLCKETRLLVKEDNNGVFAIKNSLTIESEILSQQNKLPKFITEKKGSLENSFKPSLFSEIMSYTGILGYYNPFTAEAQYNENLPPSTLPFTMAHESVHQMGFAREQEANFIGYLIGKNSQNLDLKYSTQYFTLKSLLNSIVREDPEFVDKILANYSSAMKRDRNAEKKFFTMHEGFLDDVFYFTNNLFLKSNQQEGSITYSYFIELLVKYESY